MATSGSRDFTLDVADVIEEAYERCGIEIRTGYEAETARRSLNLMFAEWANRGVNLWTVKLGTQALTAGTATYSLSNTIADLLEVVVRRDGVDFEVQRISRGEYQSQPNKTTRGRPSSFYFNRQVTPEINLWATPENSTDVLIYDALTRMNDADSMQDTLEVPFRFYPCLAAGLAYYISLKRAPERTQLLKSIYEEEFDRAASEDRDRTSLKLLPHSRYI